MIEADAAKASLYSHFGCKDQLVAAYVERRIEAARASIDAYVDSFPREERAVRFFDFVVDWTTQSGFRGCPVQHLVGEISDRRHPARQLAVAQREWLIGRLTDWARAAARPIPNAWGARWWHCSMAPLPRPNKTDRNEPVMLVGRRSACWRTKRARDRPRLDVRTYRPIQGFDPGMITPKASAAVLDMAAATINA